jgi:hypothetical protein
MADNGIDVQSLLQLVEKLMGTSPNEGFDVPPPDAGSLPEGPQVMGGALNQLQGAGIKPPLPGEVGGGNEMQMMIMQLVQALKESQPPGPIDPPLSDGTVGGSTGLKQQLLDNS